MQRLSRHFDLLLIMVIILLKCSFAMNTKAVSLTQSTPTLDIYRTTQLQELDVVKRYDDKIKKMSALIYAKNGIKNEKAAVQYVKLQNDIIADIQNQGRFAYVGLSAIRYPKDRAIHFTLDVVDADDKNRAFDFLPAPTKNIADPDDLISQWLAYERTGFALFSANNQGPIFKNCPANHCLFGFEEPVLQKYASIFNHLVPKNRLLLISVLREDRDPQKRSAAAYLLAHIKNGKEVVDVLTPSIFDSNSTVRNNVLRVIAMTLEKNNQVYFPAYLLPKLLDFPTATDRNKALYILSVLIKKHYYANYIKRHCLNLLLYELKLFQPNLHDLAYSILKQISGKYFAERDYNAWQKWADGQMIPPQFSLNHPKIKLRAFLSHTNKM